MDLNISFNRITVPVRASYIGQEPLRSFIDSLQALEETYNGEKFTRYCISLEREPAKTDIKLIRNLETDKLRIDINLNADLEGDDESARRWTIEDLDYPVFKEGVLKWAFSMLQKYGILGYSMTWDASGGYQLPFDTLLKLLGKEADYDEETQSFRSDFCKTLKQ